MTIKLKNGSKIHIKESQKGSFTKWCGGNVTSECIQRGKNSSNPKIRKKATFAANVRKWKHQQGGVIKSIFNKNSLKKSLDVAKQISEEYEKQKSIVASPIISDGVNRTFWRKKRWVQEGGEGLLKHIFKPDEPISPHFIQLSNKESFIPENTFFMNTALLPSKGKIGKGLGQHLSTSFVPNLQYNAYRYLHWTEPKVQELGSQFLNTGSLRPILNYYKQASPLEKQQLSTVVRMPMFLNSELPYKYYTDNSLVLKENPILNKELRKLSPEERKEFEESLGWASYDDTGKPIIFNKKEFGKGYIIDHEGNHAFQNRFGQPENMQAKLKQVLPAKETKLVNGKESRLSGNEKRELGSAHLNMERGSVLEESRGRIIKDFYQKNERYPTFKELTNIINSSSDNYLQNIVNSAGAYGKEYAPLIKDFKGLREILNYGYKQGGKLNGNT